MLFRSEYDFAWSVIDPIEIKEIAINSTQIKPTIQKIINTQYKDSKEIYDDLYILAEENKCFNFIDDLYEQIAEIPWAQITRISRLNII